MLGSSDSVVAALGVLGDAASSRVALLVVLEIADSLGTEASITLSGMLRDASSLTTEGITGVFGVLEGVSEGAL